MQSARNRFMLVAGVVALAYLFVGALSAAMAASDTQAIAVWLASGVSFGAMLASSASHRTAVVTGTAVATVLWGAIGHALPWNAAIAFGLIEAGSIVLGAWVASRANVDRPLQQVTLLVLGACVTGISGATLANELWRWQYPEQLVSSNEWRAWAFSTIVGILLVAPVIGAFKGFAIKRSGGMPMKQFGAGAAMFALFLVTTLIVFNRGVDARFGEIAPTLAYLPMPFLLLASMFWGPRGGSLATLVGAELIIGLTARGGGPFAVSEAFAGEAVIEVQAYVCVWAVLLLAGRALNEARRMALIDAREWQLRYERTLLATGVASVEFDPVTGAAVWGESAEAVLGKDAVQLRNIRDWLDRVVMRDRPLAQAGWDAVASGRHDGSAGTCDIRLDGRELHVHTRFASVHGPDGAVERVVCLIRAEAHHA